MLQNSTFSSLAVAVQFERFARTTAGQATFSISIRYGSGVDSGEVPYCPSIVPPPIRYTRDTQTIENTWFMRTTAGRFKVFQKKYFRSDQRLARPQAIMDCQTADRSKCYRHDSVASVAHMFE